jgi:hypothetical protein
MVGMDMSCIPFVDVDGATNIFWTRGQAEMVSIVGKGDA